MKATLITLDELFKTHQIVEVKPDGSVVMYNKELNVELNLTQRALKLFGTTINVKKSKSEPNFYIKIDNTIIIIPSFIKKIEPDWSKVPVNTPVLVRDSEHEEWYERRFVVYMPKCSKKFICFGGIADQESAINLVGWKYCKLPEGVDPYDYTRTDED